MSFMNVTCDYFELNGCCKICYTKYFLEYCDVNIGIIYANEW